MSTLSEIQAAVDKLSHPEQEILLEHLVRKLRVRSTTTEASRAQRERWLQKLAEAANLRFSKTSWLQILQQPTS